MTKKSLIPFAACMIAFSCSRLANAAPNFVVILTDDQSWVGTSALMDPSNSNSRSDYFQTPAIEQLAVRGMQFSRGYAPAPFCCPTRRSITVGQTPARHIYQKDQVSWTKRYRRQLSIPRMLKSANANYRTAHFGKWDARFDGVTPGEMGYDVSDGTTGNNTGGGNGSGGPSAKTDPKLAFSMTDRATDFMAEQTKAKRPFYVQVSHYAVHLDIFYREESLTTAKSRKLGAKHTLPEFAAMTADVDAAIGKLMDAIESLDLNETTYVFFLSDNGGRLKMPGQEALKQPRNYPLRNGKGSMYEGGLRVPFIVVGPNIKPGTTSRVPVTGLDILPTLADLAGYAEPLPESLDGGSIKNVLTAGGPEVVQRRNPFLVFHQAVARKAQSAIMMGDHKLVKTWATDKVELFDLANDISESRDLSSKHPDKTAMLEKTLVDYLEGVGAETRKTTSKKKSQSVPAK